ncbi:MAG: 6,7-dimethyl-8-ribityllumazine synthase [Vicinamibacteria bacterium]|nr:6,7-dimethyl-8-ribityllumazine synthase [Vicinamibacteria bacterium]
MKTPPANKTVAEGGRGLRVLVLQSRFNDAVVSGLAEGAAAYLTEVGATFEVEWAPGAFELPLIAQTAAFTGRYDAIVALGAVIRGETDHYEHISREAARGVMDASLTTGVPVAFGVLTTQKESHAIARARPGRHNKGREAAAAAVETALLLKRLVAPPKRKR